MSCISFLNTCPASADTENILLAKLLQVLNNGGGGGGAGVSSINFNGSGAQTGAVSLSAVTSVNGNAGPAVVLTTTNVAEGTNLYYTQARFDTAFAAKSTSDLAEGTNKYFTEARVLATVLTGFASALGAITAADSVLSAFGKTQGRLAALEAGTAGPFLLRAGDTGTGAFLFTTSVNDTIPLTLTSTAGSATTSNLFVANYGATNRVTLRNDGRLTLVGRASFSDQASGLGHVFSTVDANTATSVLVASITHTLSAGVGANGIGAILDWNLDSSTTVATRAARWSTIWSDATHATRNAVTTLNAFVAGTETPQLVIGSNQIGGPVGTVGAPSWVNRNDTTTGRWYPAASTIADSLGGVEATRLTTTGFGIGITPIGLFHAASNTTAQIAYLQQASADTSAFTLRFRKSRGLITAATIITAGDTLGTINFAGCTANDTFVTSASIRAVNTGTPAATRMASSLIFATATDAAPSVLTDALTINNAQQLIALDGSASVPSYTFSSNQNSGLLNVAGNIEVSTGGTSRFRFSTAGKLRIISTGTVEFSSGAPSAAADVVLGREAAAVLVLANTTVAPQTFRIAETTDAIAAPANYGRLSFQTQAGNYLIRTEMAGTTLSGGSAGTPRILQLGTGPSNGTNIAGANVILHSGQGTGSGVPGAILFQQALPVGGSGSGVTALATVGTFSTAGFFGVGTSSPTGPINAVSSVASTGSNGSHFVASCFATNLASPEFLGRGSRGSEGSPTAIQSGDSCFQLSCLGYDGSAYSNRAAYIAMSAEENWSNSAHGMDIEFATTAPTTTTRSEKLRITGTGLLTFQGITSTFPAIKRSSATLAFRLADDSADCAISSATHTFAEAGNIILGTTTGTKIGTATTQKLAFYNATPIVQGASIADATGGAIIDAEARTALNALISRIEALGLIATV